MIISIRKWHTGGFQVEDLIILQKAFEMMEYGYTALAQYPKSEKFALVVDIKRCMHKILEKIIEANKKYYKKTTLQELDVEIMKLKAYLRLSYNLKFLPSKKYEIWSSKSVELGRMVGGWIKSTKKDWCVLGIGYSGCRYAGAGGTMVPTPAFSTSI